MTTDESQDEFMPKSKQEIILTTPTGGGKGILELSPSNDRPAIVIVTIQIDHGDGLVV